jgi:hypothetical protein
MGYTDQLFSRILDKGGISSKEKIPLAGLSR